jgi:sterol desaturase/sphingolipid hydroxylase (fatty acid hydroxylase superfamily)
VTYSDIWPIAFWPLIVGLCFVENVVEGRGNTTAAPKRWLANFGLGLTNSALAAVLPIGTVLAAQAAASHHIGLGQWLLWPAWLAVVVWILVRSLLVYGVHLASHLVPMLWSIHRIHHSDPIIDSSTALRHHPFELLISLFVFGALALIMGIDPVIVAWFELFELVFAIATHSAFRLPDPVEKILAIGFVTPALHRIHHSAHEPETNSNYGNALIIWDRLFGTFRDAKPRSDQSMQYGLVEVSETAARDFGGLLISPVVRWLDEIKRPKSP